MPGRRSGHSLSMRLQRSQTRVNSLICGRKVGANRARIEAAVPFPKFRQVAAGQDCEQARSHGSIKSAIASLPAAAHLRDPRVQKHENFALIASAAALPTMRSFRRKCSRERSCVSRWISGPLTFISVFLVFKWSVEPNGGSPPNHSWNLAARWPPFTPAASACASPPATLGVL